MHWQNLISHRAEVDPLDLRPQLHNFRIHAMNQRQVTTASLDELGHVGDILVNVRSGRIVNGHLRVELALAENQPHVPVTYLDCDEATERIVLAFFDRVGEGAITDAERLQHTLSRITTTNAHLQSSLDDWVLAFRGTAQVVSARAEMHPLPHRAGASAPAARADEDAAHEGDEDDEDEDGVWAEDGEDDEDCAWAEDGKDAEFATEATTGATGEAGAPQRSPNQAPVLTTPQTPAPAHSPLTADPAATADPHAAASPRDGAPCSDETAPHAPEDATDSPLSAAAGGASSTAPSRTADKAEALGSPQACLPRIVEDDPLAAALVADLHATTHAAHATGQGAGMPPPAPVVPAVAAPNEYLIKVGEYDQLVPAAQFSPWFAALCNQVGTNQSHLSAEIRRRLGMA